MCTSTWSGEKTVPATIATVGTACTSAMVPAVLHNVSQKADMCARWSHSCAQRLRAAQWTVTSGYQRKINFWTPPPVQGLLKVLKFLEVHSDQIGQYATLAFCWINNAKMCKSLLTLFSSTCLERNCTQCNSYSCRKACCKE